MVRAAALLGLTVLVTGAPRCAAREPLPAPRADTVILAGPLPDSDLVALSVAVASAKPDAVFLLDTPRADATVKPFLDRFRPADVIRVAAETDAAAFVWSLFPRTERVVIAPREPSDQLLQAACLAGTVNAPLFVLADGDNPLKGLPDLAERGVKEVFAVGAAAKACRDLKEVRVTPLKNAASVARRHRRELKRGGKIETLVLTNPAALKGVAALAPFMAVKHRSALLCTGPDGTDASRVIEAALKDDDLAAADALVIAANLKEIPVERRPNPAKGKDEFIDVEPGTPDDGLFTLAVGRLFHEDRAVVPLMLARQKLLERASGPRRALVASNPGGGLPLLETFSRNTARELANAGYRVTARFDKEVDGDALRELLPLHDIFLWEGHYKTLVDDFGMPRWTEPLPPSLIFLQSCLALNEAEAKLLLDRGAAAVVGSPNRTYSGSGGAFSMAFFDALAYDGRSLGGSLRHAKNFLQCYAKLKAKRLGEAAALGGANKRAAWAFTLWGDPTLNLPKPKPEPEGETLPTLRAEVQKTTILLKLPEKRYPKTEVGPYRAEAWPNGRLAGLLTRGKEDTRRMVPFAFAEVALPKVPAGQVPQLSSKVPRANWVWEWDARRRVGYLLVLPRARDGNELRFRLKYEPAGAGD